MSYLAIIVFVLATLAGGKPGKRDSIEGYKPIFGTPIPVDTLKIIKQKIDYQKWQVIPKNERQNGNGCRASIIPLTKDIVFPEAIRFNVIISNYSKDTILYGDVQTIDDEYKSGHQFIQFIECVKEHSKLRNAKQYSNVPANRIAYKRASMVGDTNNLYWYKLEPGRRVGRGSMLHEEWGYPRFENPGVYRVYVIIPVPYKYDKKGYISSDTIDFEVKMPLPREAEAWRFLKQRLESKEPVVARTLRDSTNIPDSRIKDDPDVKNALRWLRERYAYQDVIKKYPNTKAAEYAKERLK